MLLGSLNLQRGGAVAQLGARLDGIEEVVGSNPIGSTNFFMCTVRRDPLQNVPETHNRSAKHLG